MSKHAIIAVTVSLPRLCGIEPAAAVPMNGLTCDAA